MEKGKEVNAIRNTKYETDKRHVTGRMQKLSEKHLYVKIYRGQIYVDKYTNVQIFLYICLYSVLLYANDNRRNKK